MSHLGGMVLLTWSSQAAPQPLRTRSATKKTSKTLKKQLEPSSWVCNAVQPASQPQLNAEAVTMPMPVVADLETILKERDACGVR